MAKFENAGFPLFGLSTGGGKNGEYMALCGGGGSSKTGIKNGVILLKWEGDGKVKEVATLFLSGMAPTNLALGKDEPLVIYCGIEGNCQKLTFDKETNTIEEQGKFQTDFTPTNEDKPDQTPEQRVARIFDKKRLFTGGFDGCVRVWSLSSDSLEKEFAHPSFKSKGDVKSYNKKFAICDLDLYTPSSSSSSSTLLSVCYDDAKVRIFDFEKGSILHQFDPFVPTYSFRSCRFTSQEDSCYLFTGERKQRSPSFLSKWFIGGKKNAAQSFPTLLSNLLHNLFFRLTFNPSHLSSQFSLPPFSHLGSRKIHKSFLTTLSTTTHKQKDLILTAAADGGIFSFFPDNLQPAGKLTMSHTFPVTGLSECGGGGFVLTCSADHSYGAHSVLEKWEGRGVEWGMIVVLGLLVLLIAMLLSFF